jgi:hypothetical protein
MERETVGPARLTFAILEPAKDQGYSGLTKTYVLLASSPAMNSGNPSQLRMPDQSGVNHAAGGRSKARKEETLWMNW